MADIDYKTLELSKAKILFLDGNTKSVARYKLYIESVEDTEYFCEYIRAISLVINSDFDKWYAEVEIYVRKAINPLISEIKKSGINIFDNFVTSHIFEHLITALIDNIDAVEDTDEKDKLFLLLWNILRYKFSTINLINLLYNNNNIDYSNIQQCFSCFEKPIQRSILYCQFISQAEQRLLLALSFDTIHFNYKLFDYPVSIECKIQNVINKGTMHLLDEDNDTIIEMLYSNILESFTNYKVHKNISKQNEFNLAIALGEELDEKMLNELREEETINIYGDSFFQQLPLEYLNIKSSRPLGLEYNISYVLKREPNFTHRIDKQKEITLFSQIPEYKYNNLLYKELEYAKEELIGIIDILQTQNIDIRQYTRKQATVDNLKLSSKARILHFVTHGVLIENGNVALLLAPDKNGNSLLTQNDILNIDFSSVDVVVLSACNSALGKIERGISLQGLANAFLYSGVKSVLATKNPVEDLLTSLFIPKFYRFLFDYPIIDVLRLTRKYFHESDYIDFHNAYSNKEGSKINKEKIFTEFLSKWAMWY
jgi:CHAT domain-containing protein